MPGRHVLTDKKIESAKPAPERARYMLWDEVAPSLALRVTDKGHKSFVVQRRVNGRMVKLTLGEYPALGLADARDKAHEALKDMTRGVDPRQSAPVRASGLRRESFEAAVESYIKREVEKNRRPRTQDEITRPLRKLLVPRWGSLPLRDIGPREILEVLDEISDAGKPVAANRTYSVLRRFFGWCVERHLLEGNPAANVRKPNKEEARSRALSDDELREVWLASESLGWPFGPLIQSLILTGQRRTEVAEMVWDEIDLERGQWTIPGTRTKNRREHAVPLSAPMLAILKGGIRFEDPIEGLLRKPPPYVFTTTGKTPVSGFSRAKAALDKGVLEIRRREAGALRDDSSKARPLPPWTLHDLRRSCATGMARIGIQPHIIEVVLNHSSGFRSGVAGVYQRHPYLAERRHALEAWSDHLLKCAHQRDALTTVVNLRRR